MALLHPTIWLVWLILSMVVQSLWVIVGFHLSKSGRPLQFVWQEDYLVHTNTVLILALLLNLCVGALDFFVYGVVPDQMDQFLILVGYLIMLLDIIGVVSLIYQKHHLLLIASTQEVRRATIPKESYGFRKRWSFARQEMFPAYNFFAQLAVFLRMEATSFISML